MKVYWHANIHSSAVNNSQDIKQPKRPLADEEIKKMWYQNTNYSVINKYEIIPFATTWTDVEIIR